MLYKHEPHQQVGDEEVLTEEQVPARRHNVEKAIMSIKQKQIGDENNLEKQLSNTMLKSLLMKVEVVEVYSLPRATRMVEQMGLRSGWALDVTTCDEDGRPWGLDQFEMRNRAARTLLEDKPTLLIGSPMCTAFSQMNHINYSRMDPMEVKRHKEYGRKHLEFCTRLYDMQWDTGRYFLHEICIYARTSSMCNAMQPMYCQRADCYLTMDEHCV